jgi:serine/threonine protein phosphatase PrpC
MEKPKLNLERLGVNNAGSFEFQGRRRTMEDEILVVETTFLDEDCLLFGVFDGHGGPKTSRHVAQNLVNHILSAFDHTINLQKGLEVAFMTLDASLDKDVHFFVGTTGNVCIIRKDRYICANLGDSRSVLCRDGIALPLSYDHKPNNPSERERIYNAGEFVSHIGGAHRVGGSLSVARSFGDFSFKERNVSQKDQPITAFPEIKIIARQPEADNFIITACDGLWDVYTNENAVQAVRNMLKLGLHADVAAERLVRSAYQKGSGDNISCIIVYL